MFEEEDDIEQIKEIANKLYVAQIEESYGESGIAATEKLTSAISNIYVFLDRLVFSKIVFIKSLSGNPNLSDCRKISKIDEFSSLKGDVLFVELLKDNECYVKIDSKDDESEFSQDSIVYLKNVEGEFFYANGKLLEITKFGNLDTIFIKPTFKSLEGALNNYKTNRARTSKCLFLRNDVWEGGSKGNRVVFIPKPESVMRDSLYQFLDDYLRGNKEVKREQNVDEKRPIDIRITWNYTNHVALIEIKWIGLSSSGTGYTGQSAISRANEGANQLAEYLDLFNTEQPEKSTRGYLIVFDGRRKNVKENDTNVNFADGFSFQDVEVEYNPDFSKLRRDFEKPYRFFMEPKCK